MCGIVAQISRVSQKPNLELVKKMAKDIEHRGPDDEGYYSGNWYGLGFKRLAILDLSPTGHQPMVDESQNYIIVFNGELYNFKDLRNTLQHHGYTFTSTSDSEVILKSYIHWGIDCLDKFDGMFAFIIVDKVKDLLFCARDPLGIKPLYYTVDEENIILVSEIKALRHYMPFALNHNSLYEHFIFHYVSGQQTIFQNIFRLPAGYYHIYYRTGEIKTQKYYDVSDALAASQNATIDYGSIEQQLRDDFIAHTQSDVGYNVQLSGGLDSSYLVATLINEFQQDLHTFSAELPGEKQDESKYQQIVVNKYKTHHHPFHYTGEELAENLPRAVWHHDMPLMNASSVFLMLLCDHSKKHSKVILVGEGADEIFGGYSWYKLSTKKKLDFLFYKLSLLDFFSRRRWSDACLEWGFGCRHRKKNVSPLLVNSKQAYYRREVAHKFPDLLRRIIATDQTSTLGWLLEKQDRMSMAASVEARVPYTTRKLYDFVNGFDYRQKVQPVPKAILKKLSEKYFDKDFIYRKKIAFRLPYTKWLRDKNHLGKYLEFLQDKTFKERPFYNHRAITKHVDDFLQERRSQSSLLMSLINFELWHRIFIDKTISL